MNDLIGRIHSYDILNCLYPGCLFSVFCDSHTQLQIFELYNKSIIIAIVFCYFIGMVIDRIGSFFIEKLLCLPFINFQFSSYEDFIKAKKSDAEIGILSEKNNIYRNMTAFFLLIIADTVIYNEGTACTYIFYVIMTGIFLSSYIKQSKYIVQRVNEANGH